MWNFSMVISEVKICQISHMQKHKIKPTCSPLTYVLGFLIKSGILWLQSQNMLISKEKNPQLWFLSIKCDGWETKSGFRRDFFRQAIK
jgi:hypothetical protein